MINSSNKDVGHEKGLYSTSDMQLSNCQMSDVDLGNSSPLLEED